MLSGQQYQSTSGWAHGSFTLLLCSHLHQFLLLGNKWTISSSSSQLQGNIQLGTWYLHTAS